MFDGKILPINLSFDFCLSLVPGISYKSSPIIDPFLLLELPYGTFRVFYYFLF